MKEKIRNLWLYDGLDSKEEYDSVVGDIKEQNRSNILLYAIAMSIVFIALFVVSFLVEDLSPNRMAYLCTTVFSIMLVVLSLTVAKKPGWNTVVTYLFLSMMGTFTIIIGTINEPSEPAVSFNIFLVLVPFWAYDVAWRSLVYRILCCTIYFYLVFRYKDSSVVWTDVINALAYGSLSAIIGIKNQKTKTSAYFLRNNMKKEIAEKTAQLEVLTKQTVSALANAIDAKDAYTNGHSSRVALYSKMIAKEAGMNEEEINNLFYVALLHDVGKIGVPNEIINKPGKLTDSEYVIIKEHPLIGYNILKTIDEIPEISIGALNHHERCDGKGYPNGIDDNSIPKFARIIAVADSYDAMTSNRSYRNYLPQEKVYEEIEKGKGSQFDPEYADIMLRIMKEDKDYILHE